MDDRLTRIDAALAAVQDPAKVIAGAPQVECEELAMLEETSVTAGRLFYRGVFIQSRPGAPFSVRGSF